MKNIIYNYKKGYNRPVSIPLWKWLIIILVWIISLMFYFAASIISLWFVIAGLLFQFIAIKLPIIMDTGSWRTTKEGKEYLEKYYK